MSTAGLIILQDALEIIFLALLIELDVDEQKVLDSKSFDELIGELGKTGHRVIKSGTLKAMNKQRVICKHYGQLAEPITVKTYAEAASVAVEEVVRSVLGKGYQEVFLVDLLHDGEAKSLLIDASRMLDEERWFDALVAVRKSVFVEIEIDYSIHKWIDASDELDLAFWMFTRSGHKAHSWKRNRVWIEENVRTPFDYIQVDHEKLRLDAMEWGVNTAELQNLFRLTPQVFRPDADSPWQLSYELDFPPNEATASNARYCLDRAISVLLRKQQHHTARRFPRKEVQFDPPPVYLDAPVYSKARQDSEVVHRISEEFVYTVTARVSGFDPGEDYYRISGHIPKKGELGGGADWVAGYLLIQPRGD
ncbi:hypothetical protein OVA13_11740 [Pseudoxanthomonas sp. SL93]|uniref:hypothetical protein n=1 Tax=Pseudoxanthomonas sp. SL93 TaxID=2995142 RepID=UPI00226F98FB|nr:hypothetical protein [Pseudoxanthomonas sp. SL93]WAC62073.1 hypothetical protein OVA13_11740 [Pseudoxanthomonas sp. SL93]